MNSIIYGLSDPITGELRYVGKSEKGLSRPRSHASACLLKKNTNPHKCNWVRKLLSKGLSYRIHVLQELPDSAILGEAEIFWIGYFRGMGCRLLNISTGGDAGAKGWVPSAETKARIGAGNRGKTKSPEALKKMGDAARQPHRLLMLAAARAKIVPGQSFLGKTHTAAARAKISKAKLGVAVHSAESKAKISAAMKGRVYSAETIEKMRVAAQARVARRTGL